MSLVTINPVALVSTATTFGHLATFVQPPGSDRAAILADGSDLTYHWTDAGAANGNANGRVAWILSLQDISLPAGARIEWVRPNIRAFFEAGGLSNEAVGISLGPTSDSLQLSPLRAFWSQRYANPGAFASYVGPAFAMMRTGGSSASGIAGALTDWTEEAVNSMDVGAWLTADAGGRSVDLSKLWVDVSYRRRGTVTSITPISGSTVTVNRPTIAWVPQAPDNSGNPQQGWAVRVYDEATYSAPGFSPWNPSKAVWDSGHVRSRAQSVTIGARLRDGVRYRAYVFVEQPWTGTQGTWWSAKPDTTTFGGQGDPYYTQFLVDLPPIPGQTIKALAYVAEAAIRLDVPGGYASGTSDPVSYEIERSADLGVTYEPVRGSPFPITNPAQPLSLWDYEARRGRELRYRIRPVTDFNTADWSADTDTQLDVLGSWLKDPTDSSLNRQIKLLAPFAPKRRRPQASFDALGRSDPITTTDGFKGWDGELTIQSESEAEYEAIDAMLTSGRVLLVQDPIGRQFFIDIGDATPHDTMRAVASADEPQFPVRHLVRFTVPWRSASPPS